MKTVDKKTVIRKFLLYIAGVQILAIGIVISALTTGTLVGYFKRMLEKFLTHCD